MPSKGRRKVSKGSVAALVGLPLLAAAATLVVGLAAVLLMQAVGLALVLAWCLGRNYQSAVDERAHLVGILEPFTEWAEQALAAAPTELPPEQEELRRRLQADYQGAQALLEKLRG